MSLIVGTAVAGGGSAPYQISRSLRFNPADSAYLNRTLGTSNRRTFTFSTWVKRSLLTSDQHLLGCINFAGGGSTNQQFGILFQGGDYLNVFHYNNGTYQYYPTAALYRDTSAWYHVVVAVDTTQATGSNRAKIYVNGVLQATNGAVDFTQNTDLFINCGFNTGIGTQVGTGLGNSYYFGGYMAEVYFIDGQQLTPSSFGQTNPNTGVWEPINYTGTYGTNGFELSFADNSGATSTTLGKDTSGNGNNWTPNNFSVTAGAGNDSLVDSPTSYGTDTGVGGEVRGNYCTFNSVAPSYMAGGTSTKSNGNLTSTDAGSSYGLAAIGTFPMTTGKWYWEVTCTVQGSYANIGIIDLLQPISGSQGSGVVYRGFNGNKANSGNLFFGADAGTAYGASLASGDILGVYLDMDNKTIGFRKNATDYGVAYSGIPASTYALAVGDGANASTCTFDLNCGQRPFAYTAPSGFKALCTQNLPTPTIGATSTTQANDYFNVVTYTGNASTQTITGVGFQPDIVWDKSRANAYNHLIYDAVRGVTNYLVPNQTIVEGTLATSLTSFNSNGFTLGPGDNSNFTNGSAAVAWCWNAGGSTVTNTSGTISAQVRANTTSGCSIVTWTASGVNPTIGHGLGAAPSMIIAKSRTGAGYGWAVYHASLGRSKFLSLDATTAETSYTNYWGTTNPTSTVFGTSDGAYNNNFGNMVAYCFAPVAGYSAFGSYTGNGSTDGPFVYTGFRPRWIMFKRSDGVSAWEVVDTARSTYNVMGNVLFPNYSNAEATTGDYANLCDALSNGFKIRSTSSASNSGTVIYAAFAEFPFKFSLAR